MIRYTQGNLLDANVDAVVNTVNTVGVMGKGIALMFKEAFPENESRYKAACKAGEVRTGHLFVTRSGKLMGPTWIVNFPTKRHWRHPAKLEWVTEGLQDLRAFILSEGVRSIAIPPLGCGNGKLDWAQVKPEIEAALGDLAHVDIVVYEPTTTYQNVAKSRGVEKLTVPRAMVAEMVRRYGVLGIECSLLEIQKLAWFLERNVEQMNDTNPFDLRFAPNKYGPYSDRLKHFLNGLDGSYLHCEKRLADAGPQDVIWFDEPRREIVDLYLKDEEAKPFLPALERTTEMIDGFESPLGMELLATVDWLLCREGVEPTVEAIRQGLEAWSGGVDAAQRKLRLFDTRLIELALKQLMPFQPA